ncbi:hypothetical protein GCM10011289_18510 [Paludibacterium paludis]|uniref:Peptidase C39 domain-containing protein n=1 Tax=Paludibacterium paludis TaxID=1225769 RepID=A0A918P2W4_9NEIS|nr:hypothetical protein GCM10011289_18510 [Paludibacterium paludis]
MLERLGVPYSRFPRSYPPVGLADTIMPRKGKKPITIDEIVKLYCEHGGQPGIIDAAATPSSARHKQAFRQTISPVNHLIARLLPELKNYSSSGAHGYAHSFADDAIRRIHPAQSASSVDGIEVEQSGGKTVILQQATRGCTSAVAEMLIFDHIGRFSPNQALRTRNLGNTQTILADIREAGLAPVVRSVRTLHELNEALKTDGPAIVTVDSGAGGHVVIVDTINTEVVTIRDPLHGWRVDIEREAFEAAWNKGECVQIRQ